MSKKNLLSNDNMWGYLLILPTAIGLIVFKFIPVLAGFLISFLEFEKLNKVPEFVGMANYISLFTDKFPWLFLKTLGNTLFFVYTVPLGIFVSLGLALLVNQDLKGISVFRTMYFLPLVTAVPAIALVWQSIYQPRFGLLNYLLDFIGIQGPNWLGDPIWFKPSVTLFSIWHGVGWGMMIFLAALKSLSSEYYESALIDGASRWTQFSKITFPLISPQIFFVTVMLVITSFNSFTSVYILGGGSNGGPMGSGATAVLYIYDKSFNSGNYGLGSAAAYILALIIMTITFLQFKIEKKWVFYDN